LRILPQNCLDEYYRVSLFRLFQSFSVWSLQQMTRRYRDSCFNMKSQTGARMTFQLWADPDHHCWNWDEPNWHHHLTQ
jgi:hypothetical protein